MIHWKVKDWLPVGLFIVALMGIVSPVAADRPLDIYVVNYPLKYFAERIGGQHVKVTLPVPKDVDPVYWTPGIADIIAFQQADLILLNGADYAKWVNKVSLPLSLMVDTSRGFKDQLITVKGVMTHRHGPEGEHTHEGMAFTTWLDLSLAARQASAIANVLARKRPQQKDRFEDNYRSLEKDLLALDERIKAIVSLNHDLPIVFSHPVYEYFEKAYRLNGKSVHWEPDQNPTPDQVASLKKLLKSHPAKWMIWEGIPIKSVATTLEAKGIESAVFNPCGNVPLSGNFMTTMQKNVANLELVFR